MNKQNEYEERILEIIDKRDEFTRGDLQGVVSAVVMRLMQDKAGQGEVVQPFISRLGDDDLQTVTVHSDRSLCELQDDMYGKCDISGVYYTTEDRATHFCAKHFYQQIVSGDGDTNYKLVDNE